MKRHSAPVVTQTKTRVISLCFAQIIFLSEPNYFVKLPRYWALISIMPHIHLRCVLSYTVKVWTTRAVVRWHTTFNFFCLIHIDLLTFEMSRLGKVFPWAGVPGELSSGSHTSVLSVTCRGGGS